MNEYFYNPLIMRTNRKLAKFLIALQCVLALACTESPMDSSKLQAELPTINQIETDLANISFNGKFLEFATPSSFTLTLNSMTKISDPQKIIDWGNQFAFTSARAILERAIKEQNDGISQNFETLQSKYPSGPPPTAATNAEVSDFIKKNSHILNFDSQGLITGVKIFHMGASGLVNRDGLVKVGGNILQYGAESIKIIEGGDEDKIPLLSSTNETNTAERIIVQKVFTKHLAPTDEAGARFSHTDVNHGMGQFSDNCDHVLNWFSDVTISSYNDPIYSTVLECDPPGCGSARAMDCSCHFPVIGYDPRTTYQVHSVMKKAWYVFTWEFEALDQNTTVEFKIDNGATQTAYAENSGFANIWLTPYNGPQANITYGKHIFYWHGLLCGTQMSTSTYHSFQD